MRTLARSCAALTVVALAASMPVRAEEVPDALDREYEAMIRKLEARLAELPVDRNAATHYLKAVVALPSVPERNGPLDEFIGYELGAFSPDAVTEMPGMLRAGTGEAGRKLPGAVEGVRAFAPAVAHLRRGGALEHCAFKLEWRAGAYMLMPHLAQLRDLARKATCYGKLLEHEKKPREAARVYLDVIRMGIHLDQECTMIHTLSGMGCTGIVAPAIEGLLLRGVDAGTARLLLDGLRTLPRPAFNAARALETERVWYVGWVRRMLLADVTEVGTSLDALEKLDKMLLGDGLGEHEDWIIPEDPKEIRRLLREAFGIHDGHMKLLVAAMRLPYHEGRARVERLAATQKSYWKGEIAVGHFAAVMPSVISGALSTVYKRVARCEAHLRGLQVLAAAALAKAETGKYPGSIGDLAKHFPLGVPRDPFTGGNFSYWLPEGLPAVACKADDPKVKKDRPQTYHFGLAYRRTLEKRALADWRARRAEAANTPDHDPVDVW